jgi:GTPase SAR1 family protein/phosphotransferase system HPr-like phosphotransfer protein
MEIAVVENKEQLESVAPTGSIIIWKGKEEIDDVLEEVGNSLDRYTKANLRLCKEVLFKKAVTVNKSNGKRFSTNSLSELLKTGLPAQEDLVIVESSDVSEAITLIQQLINLGMNTNVLTREEILKKKVIQNYFEHKNTFKEFLKQFEEKVKNTKSNFDITDELKQIFLKQLELIEKKLEESSDETIKVAVFATKKSGKSMIVNALLGEEYAPTSQELPTPNVIIYKPHNEKFLKLLYDEKEINFESADELKKFIRKEFNRVKISGDKLPVMTILYPKRKGINFEIYDTPGPDLASSQHGDFIDEYIEKADVSVFAVDYTKYAQSSEVELLKKIKDSFEKKGKIYSLVCAVNKLDMMYLDTDTEKIKVRVSYFMERKLRELGFKNFVVVPISAIIYFYLIKIAEYISEIKEVENLRSYLLDMEDNEEFLEEIGLPIEVFSEINAFVGKIKQIHKIKRPTYRDVVNLSGFEIFKRYLLYIAQEKALVEKIFFYIRSIDSYLTEVHNHIETSHVLLSKDIEKIRKALNKFIEEAKEEFTREKFNEFFKRAKEEFSDKVKYMLNDISETVEEEIEGIIENARYELRERMRRDIYRLKRKNIGRKEFEEKYKEITFRIDKEYVCEELVNLLEKSYEECEKLLEKFKHEYSSMFEETKKNLEEAIKSLEDELNRSFSEANKISIQLPELDLEFEIEGAKKSLREGINRIRFSSSETISSEVFSKAIHGGFFKFLGSFFGGDRYEVDEESLLSKIDEIAKDFNKELIEEIKRHFSQLNNELEIAKKNFTNSIERGKKETEIYLNSVYEPIKKLKSNLDRERTEKQAFKEFLTALRNEWQNLVTAWKKNIVGDYSKFKEVQSE